MIQLRYSIKNVLIFTISYDVFILKQKQDKIMTFLSKRPFIIHLKTKLIFHDTRRITPKCVTSLPCTSTRHNAKATQLHLRI